MSAVNCFGNLISNQTDTVNIYITIDDGPSACSFFLGNIAMANKAPLNVFIVGDSVNYNESRHVFFQLYQANPFIEIGNHSFSHAYRHYHFYYEHPEDVVKDFELNNDTLCLQTITARLPGRNTWRTNGRKKTDLPDDSTAADMLSKKNYRIFGWDLEWRCEDDSCGSIPNANILMQKIESVIQKSESFTPNNIIILCHETMFLNAGNRIQLEKLLQMIKQKANWRLQRLSNYPGKNESARHMR